MTNTQTLPFRLLSKKEVAAILGYTVRTVDRLVEAEHIPFVRIPCGVALSGRTRVKFNSVEIEKWIRNSTIAGSEGATQASRLAAPETKGDKVQHNREPYDIPIDRKPLRKRRGIFGNYI